MGHFSEVLKVLCILCLMKCVSGIGANWGTQASHPLPPDIVVQMLKDNGFQKVKLFDAEDDIMDALRKSGIQVMVGIPNDLLAGLASSEKTAENWVSTNVSKHVNDGVDIRYVAVGNEPFLQTFNGSYLQTTFPALQNIQAALIKAGLSNQVKVTVPLNADVYESSSGLPSGGDFRANIHDLMLSIVKFLNDNAAPFTVNIYPFISLYDDPNFPLDYAFFQGAASPVIDGAITYNNVFDANHDTLVAALRKNGREKHPTRELREALGIFYYDGKPKYQLSLGSTNSTLVGAKGVKYQDKKWCVFKPTASLDDPKVAPSVSYACGNADCTSLGYKTSCGDLDARGNISYAFNSYFQENDQDSRACDFSHLATVTTEDPSTPTCKFIIMIDADSAASWRLRPVEGEVV
uniref:X8 domain-containing protein n=1 Tax=Ananas comosus var. bracteatus TaxID=296719 RepID=A0A6V7QBE8_ANACO|nr:unnamed protein product [Ananas comosus var. bracteatus]